jgi:putative tricarboxylic transport membrane protein
MRKADIACAVILLCIGLLVMVESIRLEIGWGMEGPRAGFYPFVLSLGMVVGSFIVLVQAFQRKGVSASREPFIPRTAIAPVLKCVVPAALMVFLTEYIGLYVAAGLYLAVYMRWIGRHRWGTVLVLSIAIPLASYIVFDKLFLIPMPEGSLRSSLPF